MCTALRSTLVVFEWHLVCAKAKHCQGTSGATVVHTTVQHSLNHSFLSRSYRLRRPVGGATPTWPSVCASPCGCLPSWSPTPSSPPPSSTLAAASPSSSSSPSQSSSCPWSSSWSSPYASCGPCWTIDSCSKAGEVWRTLWPSSAGF